MPTIAEILREAAGILRESGLAEPRREANSLLGHALGKDRAYLIAHSTDPLTEAETTRFRELLARRAGREPLQQITGRQEFYGLDFLVTRDVLIPRPETELIVEQALEILPAAAPCRFCEVGVGSGCISIAVLHHRPAALAVALDVSPAALDVACRNAEKHGVTARLALVQSDVFAALKDERFDLVVSNPPYVPARDVAGLQPEVRDFEPVLALTDGHDGFSIIERIIDEAPRFLTPGGFLLMEIGFGQAAAVRAMLDPARWPEAEILADLQGIPRTVRARLGANK